MVDPITLENWVEPVVDPVRTILSFAQTRGEEGFTVDDLRFWLTEGFPVNPGAVLGSLCSHGRLRAIGVERSRVRSSKGRVVRRFALAEAEP